MTNREVARLLNQVAAAYIVKNENRFKIIAYERAAEAISKSNVEIKDLWQDGKLESLPGIGAALRSHLDELFRTGKVRHFESVFKNLPAGMFTLLDIPGFGPKKAYRLATIFKLNDRDSATVTLLNAAREGKIAPIEGFGDKSQTDIIEALEGYKKGQTKAVRMPLPYAYVIAENIIDYLKKHQDVLEAVPLGSLRRFVATVGDIDVAVSTDHPEAVLDWFIKYPKKEKVIEKGSRGATIALENGKQIDLRVVNPRSYGSMLQYFTGSKQHNINLREFALKKGLSLNEYGIKPLKRIKNLELRIKNYNKKNNIYEFTREEDFYKALGLAWIPAELREDAGEIDAALRSAQGRHPGLPNLVELKDIKGDLHIHSDYDLEPSHDLGSSPVKELLTTAAKLKYEYIGISDHNPSVSKHTSSQIISIIKARKLKFEQIVSSIKSVRVHLFSMLEIDILPDGKLAIPNDAFNYLDAAFVSVHSSFKMPKDKMTDRIIKGLSHPKAKILAHPTGRLLGKREGYEIDWEKLFNFCRAKNKAMEINAYPDRLDLADILVREAMNKKVKLIIDTDSHDKDGLAMMKYGVYVARRGWAERNDILNTLSYNEMRKWLI